MFMEWLEGGSLLNVTLEMQTKMKELRKDEDRNGNSRLWQTKAGKFKKDLAKTRDSIVKAFNGLVVQVETNHEAGIAHRDIKLDNIMFTKDRKELRLIDWGVSWNFGKNESPKKFMETANVGTNAYKLNYKYMCQEDIKPHSRLFRKLCAQQEVDRAKLQDFLGLALTLSAITVHLQFRKQLEKDDNDAALVYSLLKILAKVHHLLPAEVRVEQLLVLFEEDERYNFFNGLEVQDEIRELWEDVLILCNWDIESFGTE